MRGNRNIIGEVKRGKERRYNTTEERGVTYCRLAAMLSRNKSLSCPIIALSYPIISYQILSYPTAHLV